MTAQEYSERFDKILERYETQIAKVNAIKASSSFTETLDRRTQNLGARLSDALDALDAEFEASFQETDETEINLI